MAVRIEFLQHIITKQMDKQKYLIRVLKAYIGENNVAQ